MLDLVSLFQEVFLLPLELDQLFGAFEVARLGQPARAVLDGLVDLDLVGLGQELVRPLDRLGKGAGLGERAFELSSVAGARVLAQPVYPAQRPLELGGASE